MFSIKSSGSVEVESNVQAKHNDWVNGTLGNSISIVSAHRQVSVKLREDHSPVSTIGRQSVSRKLQQRAHCGTGMGRFAVCSDNVAMEIFL